MNVDNSNGNTDIDNSDNDSSDNDNDNSDIDNSDNDNNDIDNSDNDNSDIDNIDIDNIDIDNSSGNVYIDMNNPHNEITGSGTEESTGVFRTSNGIISENSGLSSFGPRHVNPDPAFWCQNVHPAYLCQNPDPFCWCQISHPAYWCQNSDPAPYGTEIGNGI
jgi:hypothetical protein